MTNTINDFFSGMDDHKCIVCGIDDDKLVGHYIDGELQFHIHPECEAKQDAERAERNAAKKARDARVWGNESPSINNEWSK